jgi:hypothetical protein
MSALLSRPYTFMQKVESLERQINPVDLLHCCNVLGVDFIEFMTRFDTERAKLPLVGTGAEPRSKPNAS